MLAHKMYILCVLIYTLGFTAGVAILKISLKNSALGVSQHYMCKI